MSDINRRCTDASEPEFPRTEAKVRIFEVTGGKDFRQGSNRVETSAGNVKAKTDPTWDVDNYARVAFRGDCIDSFDIITRSKRIGAIWDRKADKLAVV